ncbi:3-hydroxyacyl-CoA dehydrogenase NAD-binding domain-containing protein [Ensifer soli]|uniref:3-hydroxyacyl-CoA dehydrogenase NAD-binding domain-containing protein n=1 Tax=Ciceribacter sp. sgz301302 TaxID=3342379 RepID=UPI0035BA041E
MDETSRSVHLEIRGTVAIVTIDSPPVNALSNAVRRDLKAVLDTVAGRGDLTFLVLHGARTSFVAGADIREMDLPAEAPSLPEVVQALDRLAIPTLAAITGACLGGGLEIAMACDARIATADARLGLPETTLGIVPGAGGTQRLPRLVGPRMAAEMIGSARLLTGAEARDGGLVDLLDPSPLAAALTYGLGLGKRRVSDLPCMADDSEAFAETVAALKARHRRSVAATTAIDLVVASTKVPFEEAVARERAAFLTLKDSDTARALRYAFLAERGTGAGMAKWDMASLRQVGVVGGGTMGTGIALAFGLAGVSTTVIERDDASCAAARTRFADQLAILVGKGRVTQVRSLEILGATEVSTDWQALRPCGLVVEAVYEDAAVKKEALAGIVRHITDDALVATNTSYLDLDALAGAVGTPSRFVGLHFFAPAHVMKLVEIVPAAATSRGTIEAAMAIVRRLSKTPVLSGNREGFIGNRIFDAYRRHMEYLLEDGADPDRIDGALEAYGFAMGPFAVFDLSGLDIAWAMRKRKAATRDPRERYVRIADRLCEAGDFGRKTGQGWYDYSGTERRLSARAAAVIDEERAARGIERRPFTDEEIVARALSVMANEGAALLAEGVAASVSDIDVVMISGYGFPRAKGGPMYAADRTGLSRVVDEMEAAIRAGGGVGEVAPLLRKLADTGEPLASLPRRAPSADR